MTNHLHRGDKIYEKDLLDCQERVMSSLTGKHKHYCMDWDGMAIDETCPEFECCTCINASPIAPAQGGGAVDNGGNSDG